MAHKNCRTARRPQSSWRHGGDTNGKQQKINSKIYKSSYLSKKNTLQLIAEVKRKSPSKGIIRSQFDPLKIANEFVESGANAISVLTDEPFFGGSSSFSVKIIENQNISLPIQNNQPDYQLMETLISAIQKLVIKDVVLYADRKIEATKSLVGR
jgi:indole-3-glycerol phosphate synthase